MQHLLHKQAQDWVTSQSQQFDERVKTEANAIAEERIAVAMSKLSLQGNAPESMPVPNIIGNVDMGGDFGVDQSQIGQQEASQLSSHRRPKRNGAFKPQNDADRR